MATMKAVRIHSFGGPQVLSYDDVERPEPGAGQILVRVHAASINPIDWKTREGQSSRITRERLPVTLGRDISGVVAAIGDGVTQVKRGDAVYAMLGAGGGGYADYALVEVRDVAPKPDNLSHVEAAAVPLAAITAWQGLFDHGDLRAFQRVLIHGAAGGVGHFAVQFAKAEEAHVYATASADHAARLRQLGADTVIDYTARRFEDVAHGVDLVLDLIGGETQARSWALLKPGGALVSTVAEPAPEIAAAHGARGIGVTARSSGELLRKISALIELGEVKPIVQAVLPLAQAPEALEVNRHGHSLGKTVLRVA